MSFLLSEQRHNDFQSMNCERVMGDWLHDEFCHSVRGHFLHEIEWAKEGRWLIVADDIEFSWQPLEAEPA